MLKGPFRRAKLLLNDKICRYFSRLVVQVLNFTFYKNLKVSVPYDLESEKIIKDVLKSCVPQS